jgi:hypothetical protein
MKKDNFLEIYGRAHLKTMQSENVKAAFRKTGTWPVNPGAVTAEMTAPSKVTSKESHLSVVPPTPVRVVADMLKGVTDILVNDDLESDAEVLESDVEIGDEDDQNPFLNGMQPPPMQLATILEDVDEEEGEGDHDSIDREEVGDEAAESRRAKARSADPALATRTQLDKAEECIRKAVKRLGESLLTTYVASHSISNPVSTPISVTLEAALSIQPKTDNERILLAALHESTDQSEYQKRRNLEIQAAGILNATYCKSLAEKLAAQENAKSKSKKKKLMSDGLPVLLTDDFFYEKVVEFEAEVKRKEREKAARRQVRADKSKADDDWKQERTRREEANAKQRADFLDAVSRWEERKRQWAVDKAAKKVTGRFPLEKPKLGKLLSLAKPKGGWKQPQSEVEELSDEGQSSGGEVIDMGSDNEGVISDSD